MFLLPLPMDELTDLTATIHVHESFTKQNQTNPNIFLAFISKNCSGHVIFFTVFIGMINQNASSAFHPVAKIRLKGETQQRLWVEI